MGENNEHEEHEEHDHEHHDHAHTHDDISGTKVFWVALFNLIITLTEFVGGIMS